MTYRLVDALSDGPDMGHARTWFILHIDTKAEEVQQALLSVFQNRPNVILMEEGRCAAAPSATYFVSLKDATSTTGTVPFDQV